LSADGLAAAGAPDTIVRAIPPGGHSSRSLAFDSAGFLFVNVGSDSNVCTARQGERGLEPCPELGNRAGIWRYSTERLRQFHAHDGERWASGFRNAVALSWDSSSNQLFAASHGRDGLATLWPGLYTSRQSAEQPSEEFAVIERGDDFGWPYCFHDNALGKKVLAPEYGGDGHSIGRCANAKAPLIGFPGHWGPDGLLFLRGDSLPAKYRGAALIAFHGSWNRAPEPQAGYQVVLVPRVGSTFGPGYETFADGFAGGRLDPGGARYRPVGLAQDGSGAIYLSDDQRGRIWRVIYTGNR
jgi:glucose/arabinose dehydrogenase